MEGGIVGKCTRVGGVHVPFWLGVLWGKVVL